MIKRLNAAISHARLNSRYYNYLPALPLDNMSDFRKLPFVTGQDIIKRGNSMVCCPASNIRRMVSSGTTDIRKRLAFSDADIEATVSFFNKGMSELCKSGDTVAIFMPGTSPDSVGALLSQGLRRFGARPALYGAISDFADAAGFCERECPYIMVGIPSQIRRLALTAPQIKPRRVLLSADYAAQSLIDSIERIWDCEVYNHYGLTESGLGCAVETPARDGMRPRKDIYIETVDSEIVITTLEREAMPLIRYKTGDCGELLPNGNIGDIFGRISELSKPTPIYTLDELLFCEDAILDFSAEIQDGILTVCVLGDENRAKKILTERGAFVKKGQGFFTTGTQKRAVKIFV